MVDFLGNYKYPTLTLKRENMSRSSTMQEIEKDVKR